MLRLAAKLKELREGRGLSQPALSAEIGVAQPHISAYERGRKAPDIKTLQKYSRFFDVPVEAIDPYRERANKQKARPRTKVVAFQKRTTRDDSSAAPKDTTNDEAGVDVGDELLGTLSLALRKLRERFGEDGAAERVIEFFASATGRGEKPPHKGGSKS